MNAPLWEGKDESSAQNQPCAEKGPQPSSPHAQHSDGGFAPELDLGSALAEIAFLRQCLEGAIIGDRIIRDQLAGAEQPILQWAHKQAAHNIVCVELSLKDSRADFPWEGRAALSKAEQAQ